MKRSCVLECLLISAIMLSAAVGPAAGGEGAYAKATDKELAIGNDCLELGFAVSDGKCRATRLVNKLTRRTIPIAEDGFSIGVEGRDPLRPADFVLKKALQQAIPGGRCLKLCLEGRADGLKLDVVYELGDGDHFLRRRLELSIDKPLALRQVDVWRVGVKGTCSHQGFGEPVFLEDTFWGLEFPGGHNHFAGGLVKLTQYPGRTAKDRFVSKTAVLGVAEAGRVAHRFRRYVRTFQATPAATKLFVNYNTWWTLMPPTEKNCLALIDTFKRNLFDPYGQSFDTFTIDDGWDDKATLWKIRPDRFPKGFAPLIAPLKAMKANLGLWLSPSSGYHHAPHLAKQGYEHNSNPWYCCQSGPKYRRDIVKVVTGLAKQYDMAFFKFDGFCASCEAKGHGHLPGAYAREANIDAYIELMGSVPKARPGVYLDPTCGMWLSPWWLKYCDSIWGSVSGDYPSIVVPAPVVRDSATATRDAVFRQRCREHPGFPPAAIEHLGIIVITPEKWEDNAMAVVGRGARLLTLYLNPKFFRKPKADWAFLASLLKWVRHNAATLQHTELIGGDPLKREVYGYAHFRGCRGILSLRNPFIEPRTVKIKLDESVGWSAADARKGSVDSAPFAARIVYPRQETLLPVFQYGRTLELRLQAYEQMTVYIEPFVPEPGVVLGVRSQETQRAGKQVRYAVYGRAGQKLPISIVGAAGLEKARLDGKPVTVSAAKGQMEVSVAFPGAEQDCTVQGGRLALDASQDAWHLAGKCAATVPPGAKATMHVLCEPRAGLRGRLRCAAQVNGKPAAVRAVQQAKGGRQTHKRHAWTWFQFDVPAGRNEVAVAITSDKGGGFFRGEVGWWLWAEHPLQKRTLTLEFDKPLPPAGPDPLPLPLRMDRQRQIVTIQAPKLMRLGTRWPKADKKTVRLDETAPDEARQDWGTLQRNQSVWSKPMIIAGKKFTRGLGTHANSRIVYDLAGGRFRSFRCLVGRDQHADDGRIVFQVRVDNKKVFDSGPMTKASEAKPVAVDLTGASALELLTLDGGDGISGDHGNWADAQLLR